MQTSTNRRPLIIMYTIVLPSQFQPMNCRRWKHCKSQSIIASNKLMGMYGLLLHDALHVSCKQNLVIIFSR